MYEDLKQELNEILDVVNLCPDNFKEKCFEILLQNYLLKYTNIPIKKQNETKDYYNHANPNIPAPELIKEEEKDEEEISLNQFHVKIRRLLEDNGITEDLINALYYKEDGKLMPLYDSLKSNRMSECQIRLSLLTAFENSFEIANGNMIFNGEIIRQRCQDMKCYDLPHFANTYSRFSHLFDNWDGSYEKEKQYSLSSDGKRELVKLLRIIAESE